MHCWRRDSLQCARLRAGGRYAAPMRCGGGDGLPFPYDLSVQVSKVSKLLHWTPLATYFPIFWG